MDPRLPENINQLALRARLTLSSTLSSLISGHRLAFYGLLSVLLAAAAVWRAASEYGNFYSAAVWLSRSAGSVLALANLGFFCTLLFGRLMQRVFFGPLRASEVERLYDRIWYFLTESLLAFTIFRDSFDTPFILQFGLLLFLKSFHWLLGDRIEWMDQLPYPGPGWGFHVRTNVLFGVLWTADLVALGVAVESVLTEGVGGVVLFGNEYAILAATLINYMLRYLIICYDIRRARQRGGENAPPWQDKSMWIFYTELFTDFLKLLTYLLFFIIVLTFYGLPLNIMREVYLTTRSFVTRVRDLVRYRSATRNMDQRYPDATAEELERSGGGVCIICRDEMHPGGIPPPIPTSAPAAGQAPAVPAPAAQPARHDDGPNMTPKKLPCGHIFHFQCLRSWLERQQSCPTCRRTVLEPAQPAPPAARGNNQPAAAAAAAPQPGAAPVPPAAGQPPHAPNHQPLHPQQNPLVNPLQGLMPQQFWWQFGQVDPAVLGMNLGGMGGMGGAWGGLWAGQLGQMGQVGQMGQGGQGGQPAQPGQGAPVPTPTTPAPAPAPADAPAAAAAGESTTPSTQETGSAGDPQDPRRAAAEAALRRMGIARAPSTPAAGSSGPAQPQPQPTPTVQIPSSSTSSTAAGPSTATPAQPQPQQQQQPLLIPLFTPPPGAAMPQLSLTPQQLAQLQLQAGVGFPFPYNYPVSPLGGYGVSPGAGPSAASRPPLSSTTTAASGAATAASGGASSNPAKLTLEEVDETLQTLERLQGVVWESVEELVRVRSRLSGVLESQREGKGKGRAVEQDQEGEGEEGLRRRRVQEDRERDGDGEGVPSYYS